ncbi:hypothetical protein BSL78_17101 [Apostichopus japonicus]|uniref:Uncharacterized protein n=1 Tax=Stichopus japonicus TaxID=307972 RepID=A0A2G8KDJ9_STIJA|nr:hypothetical protein BSL78_17101 [Apostichopus japonicus]
MKCMRYICTVLIALTRIGTVVVYADLSDTSDSEVSPDEQAGEVDSAPVQQNVASNNNESQLQMYVQGLSREQLEQVAVELLRRNPDAHSDLTAPNQNEEVTLLVKSLHGANACNV